MTVETTTITTDNMTVENLPFTITTFEQTTTAFCDCCPNQATGTKEQLKRQGWSFGNGSEFCSECNY